MFLKITPCIKIIINTFFKSAQLLKMYKIIQNISSLVYIESGFLYYSEGTDF